MIEYSDHDLDTLAKTIYGEARGDFTHPRGGLAALIAVGNVVMNRVKTKYRKKESVAAVCLSPKQFSCWNLTDPNIKTLTARKIYKDELFKLCQKVAPKVAYEYWPDLTNGSDHYHATYVKPAWMSPQHFKIRIGRHLFYKLK